MSTAKRLITAEDLYRIELPSDVRLSPDGSQIAFLSNRADKEKPAQVYLIPFGGGEARKLTDIQGEIGELSWSPDGKKLLCTVRKTDREDLEREKDEQKKKLGVVARHYDRVFYKLDGYGYLPHERTHRRGSQGCGRRGGRDRQFQPGPRPVQGGLLLRPDG